MSWVEPNTKPARATERFAAWLSWFLAEFPPALFGDRFNPEPIKHLCYVLSVTAALVSVLGVLYSAWQEAGLPAYVVYGGFGLFSELCFRAGYFFARRQLGNGT